MTNLPLLIILVIISILIFFAVLLIIINGIKKSKTKQPKKEVSYDAFLTLGFIFLIAGVIGKTSGMWMLGLIFLIIGSSGMLRKKIKID